MKKFLYLIFLIFLSGCTTTQRTQVSFNDQDFNVEVVSSHVDRAQGLMFRTSLDEDKGMLFIFPNTAKHSFWMKNTYIPLDIIWINEALEVVHIHNNATPCQDTCSSLTPSKEAKYVLEINAGLAEEYNLKVGDKISLEGLTL